jgi:hypothetical protein
VREVALWTAITLGTLLFLEGAASALMLVRDRRNLSLPERLVRPRTVPDTLLGWRNAPGYAKADEYGKDIALHTTADGLRATTAGDSTTAAGIVCSGDSFTFGPGVGDDRTWCALLAAALPGVRTYNMGQELYGLDQSYLWYRRDGVRQPHAVQILALTNPALERATSPDDAGWFEPRLAVEGERLGVRGVPVPAQTREALERAAFGRAIDELRIVQAAHRLPSLDPVQRRAARVDEQRPLIEAVLRELAALHRTRGTRLVVAYLPTSQDVRTERLDARRRWLAETAQRQGIAFVDLTPAFRALRRDSLDLAFISRTSPVVSPRAAGQYSALGHALVAHTLAPALAVQARTEPRDAARTGSR